MPLAQDPPADPPPRRRSRRALRWAVEGLVLLVAVAAFSMWQSRGHPRGDAPPFSLRTLDGAAVVTTEELRGAPALVVFWAPWCGVCRVESANVSWVQRIVGARARVVSIASEYDDTASVHRYVLDRDVDYPVLMGGRETARAYQVHAFPTAFVLDAQGRITSSVVGYTTTFGLLWRLLTA